MPISAPIKASAAPQRANALTVTDLAAEIRVLAEEHARLHTALTRIAGLLPTVVPPRPAPVSPDYLTVADAARFLKVDRTTIYAWMDHEGMPFQYVGTRRRIRSDALEVWLADQEGDNRRSPGGRVR